MHFEFDYKNMWLLFRRLQQCNIYDATMYMYVKVNPTRSYTLSSSGFWRYAHVGLNTYWAGMLVLKGKQRKLIKVR